MIVRANFPDEFLQTMLPAINSVVMGEYAALPPQFEKIYNVKTSARSIEQMTEVAGFGQFGQVPENSPVNYDDPIKVFNQTWIHGQYGLGFRASKVSMDDDKFGIISRLGVELGKSASETREVLAASVFNNGFSNSFLGPDGVSLFSTAHPLVGPGAGTQTNRLSYATDPDITSVQLALTDIRNTRDHRGKKIRIAPETLVVPPSLEFVAREVLGGPEWRSDTANRTPNALRQRSGAPSFDKMEVWDYLTDPHAWFITARPAQTKLVWFEREKFNTVHDIDFDSRGVKTAGWMRFSFNWLNPWGLYGIPSS